MTTIRALFGLAACLSAASLAAAPSVGGAQAKRVRKLTTLVPPQLDSAPPFDEPFVLRVTLPDGMSSASLRYAAMRDSTVGGKKHRPAIGVPGTLATAPRIVSALEPKTVAFEVGALEPYQSYAFVFEFQNASGQATVDTVVTGTNASYKDRFDTDFGVVWSPYPGPRFVGAASNVHFYFVPINPRERHADYTRIDRLTKNVSLYAGLTLARFHAGEEVVDFFSAGNLVVGLGARPGLVWWPDSFLNFFRLHAGLLLFKQDDPNPTVTHTDIKASPVIGIGADFEIRDFFGPLVGILGIKP